MAYTKLLNKIIEESGLTIKEIAQKCKEYGENVTPAYISTLRNDKNNRTPSNEISRALAKACNCQYENILCVEAYLEKAPEEFNGLIELLREMMFAQTMAFIENQPTTQDTKAVRKIIEEYPMAEFICTLSNDELKQSISKQQGANKIKTSVSDGDIKIIQKIAPTGLSIADDGMSPQIDKGDMVTVEVKKIEDYNNGDIICYQSKTDKKKIFARKIIFNNKNKKDITLIPINSAYIPEQTDISQISIIGKVTKIIKTVK